MLALPADALDVLDRRVATVIARVGTIPPPAIAPTYDTVKADIVARLKVDYGGLPHRLLYVMTHTLEIAVKLGHASPASLSLYRLVVDATNHIDSVAAWEDEDAWLDALELAHRYRSFYPDQNYLDRPGSRASVVAGALKRLKALGYDYEMSPYRVGPTEAAFEAACHAIEDAIVVFGGINAADTVFNDLKTYRGLFLYGRRTSGTLEARPSSVPWHFLFNLALKHLVRPKRTPSDALQWPDALELARDVAATLDVEAYSQFDGVDINPFNIDRSVLDNTFYDELFSFQQWSAESAERLSRDWIGALLASGCTLPLASAAEWCAFIEAMAASLPPARVSTRTPHALATAALPEATARRMMAALACPQGGVNAAYRTPLQTSERNAPLYPFYELKADTYVVPPWGLAARGLYERLFELMREAGDARLENKLGAALEALAIDVMTAAGQSPSVMATTYTHPTLKKDFELDLLLETPTDVVLIECKRKALTRSARGAGVADALSDLTKGFIEPYLQMARHELALRSTTTLAFHNGRSVTLGDRNVTRIALTMLDHGSLQNRTFMQAVVRVLLGRSLASADTDADAKLKKVSRKANELLAVLQALQSLDGQPLDRFLQRYQFGTWWLSVDQLALIASNAPTLVEALAPMRHVTFQTGDLMNELLYAEMMRAQAATS